MQYLPNTFHNTISQTCVNKILDKYTLAKDKIFLIFLCEKTYFFMFKTFEASAFSHSNDEKGKKEALTGFFPNQK